MIYSNLFWEVNAILPLSDLLLTCWMFYIHSTGDTAEGNKTEAEWTDQSWGILQGTNGTEVQETGQ